MFLIMTSEGIYKPRVVASYPSFNEAVEAAYEKFQILDFEIDNEHEGCADFYTKSGALYMIEPAGRRKL